MAVVYKSDLSGGSISSLISMLETEVEDTQQLINSINGFIDGTKSSLTGKAYDLARQKMSMYVEDLKMRKSVASQLASAISAGASSLSGYMEEFSMLDDSEMEEIVDQINKLKVQISGAKQTINSLLSSTESVDYKNIWKYRGQISIWESIKSDLERKLDKLVGLQSADASAFGGVEAAGSNVAKYGASIDGISISSIT